MLYALLSNIVWTESDCLAGMVDGGGRVVHHHDWVTSGQYVLFQHPIILSLDYDGPIWNSKVKYMDFEKLKK